MIKNSNSKNFVVTGGARGLGEAIVLKLSENPDHRVFYCYKSAPNEHFKTLPNVLSFQANCSQQSECKGFAEFILKHVCGVHCLINNVGVGLFSLVNNVNLQDWSVIHKTNICSALWMYQFLIKSIRSVKGTILNIGSVAYLRPSRGTGAYAASKAALSALTSQMAYEEKDFGVKVSIINPGFILTEALKKPEYVKIREKNLEQIPLSRFGGPEEVANSVSEIIHSEILTDGHDLSITGGQHINN